MVGCSALARSAGKTHFQKFNFKIKNFLWDIEFKRRRVKERYFLFICHPGVRKSTKLMRAQGTSLYDRCSTTTAKVNLPFLCPVDETIWNYPQSTYIYRVQSSVWRLWNY
jgi:hypothetical protein